MTMRLIACLAPISLLAACGGTDDGNAPDRAIDPTAEQALGDNLMTDPDMAGRNEGGAALSGTGNGAIPRIDTSASAIDAARARAFELVGGPERMKPAPAAKTLPDNAQESVAMAAAAHSAVAPGGMRCTEKVSYTSAWAARLPAEFPVYPRANTLEAAGTDEGACGLRVVTFVTPVALDEVLSFYATRAAANGYGVEHSRRGDESVLSGMKGRSAYVVYARKQADGVTEIDLVTSAG